MSIRDLVSNNVLTLALVMTTLNNSSVNSAAIDMSDGTTGAFQCVINSAGAASVTLSLEYSEDGSNWFADDGETGNMIVDAACEEVVDGIVDSFPALVIGIVVNPRITAQFARLVATETATVAADISIIGSVGPRRLLDTTDAENA